MKKNPLLTEEYFECFKKSIKAYHECLARVAHNKEKRLKEEKHKIEENLNSSDTNSENEDSDGERNFGAEDWCITKCAYVSKNRQFGSEKWVQVKPEFKVTEENKISKIISGIDPISSKISNLVIKV